MARWKLQSAHYLNVQGIEWEYTEQALGAGRGKQVRKRFAVPQLLNPEDPSDHNYPGEIIVAWEGKGQGQDIIFSGAPTPEMEPLDAEAKAVSQSESRKWQHPIESLPGQGELYSQSLLSQLERAVDAIVAGKGQPPTPNAPVPDPNGARLAALEEQVQQLMEINRALMAERQTPEEEPLLDPDVVIEPVTPEPPHSDRRI